MLLVAVLLASGLMAASEVPELLTLTDNVSNDYEVACQRVPGCSPQEVVRTATMPAELQFPHGLKLGFAPAMSPTVFTLESASSVSTLNVQRK